ncbi:MAG: metal ABC transporter permease [Acidobacteriota bacterium]
MLETLALVKWPLLAAALASLPLSYYGVFLVERRMVFVSVTLAQSALCGAALSFLAGWEARIGALLVVALTITLLAAWGSRTGRHALPEDSVLGVLYVVLGALAVVFLSKSVQGGLDEATLLFGSLLGVSLRDVQVLAAMVALLALLHGWGYRRFLAVTFDAETSRVLGMRVPSLELAFFAGLGALLAVAISQIGVLLSFGYLVLPAAAARAFGRGTRSVFLSAGAIGVLGSAAGTLASIHWDVPTGAAICLALAVPLPVAELVRARRG